MIKLGKKFQKMIPLYEMFAKEFASNNIDFSDKAKEDMYRYETYGEGFVDERNGYFLGKKILNLQVTSWKEDMRNGLLYFFELYEDKKYPHWWLNSVLKGSIQEFWLNKNPNTPVYRYIDGFLK